MRSTKRIKKETVYIIPTRYGLLYGILVFLFLIAGTIYANNSVLLASGLLVTFGLVCMHQTHYNVAHVNLDRLELESGFSQSNANWKLRLTNNAPTTCFSINIREAVMDVPPGWASIENIPFRLRNRGFVKLKELKISSTYPFGLFYAWKWWEGEANFYVYPALLPEVRLPRSRKTFSAALDGHDDFLGHRVFVPGDSARHIDWRLQARKQKTMVKLFNIQNPEAVMLDWDATEGETEHRLSVLATAVRELYRQQKPFGLILPDQKISPQLNRNHYESCLRALALYGGDREQDAS